MSGIEPPFKEPCDRSPMDGFCYAHVWLNMNGQPCPEPMSAVEPPFITGSSNDSVEPPFKADPHERIYGAAELNAAAGLVLQVAGRHVLLSKRYAIAEKILRVIEEGLARA